MKGYFLQDPAQRISADFAVPLSCINKTISNHQKYVESGKAGI